MSVESNTTIEELGDKGHWLRKFRKAKNLNTLQLMVSNAIDKHHKTLPLPPPSTWPSASASVKWNRVAIWIVNSLPWLTHAVVDR